MLAIRFQRTGRRNSPAFRLVVAEKRAAAGGKVKEYLGYYLPTRQPHTLEVREDRIRHWLSVGARPSCTAARLLGGIGIAGMEKFIQPYTKKNKKKQAEGMRTQEQSPQETQKDKSAEPAKEEAATDSSAGTGDVDSDRHGTDSGEDDTKNNKE